MIKRASIIIWYWTPVVLWMALLFFSSSVPGDNIPKIDIPNIDKLFHFIEYFILGALLVRAFSNTSGKVNFKIILLLSVIIASLYGVLDEFHQHFTPGRSPEIFDVISDIIGSLFGAMLLIHKEKASHASDKTV